MPWRHIGEVEVYIHSFLISSLDVDKWSTSCPRRRTAEKGTRYPFIRRLDGSQRRFGWYGEAKYFRLPLFEKDSSKPSGTFGRTAVIRTEIWDTHLRNINMNMNMCITHLTARWTDAPLRSQMPLDLHV
jgi:hypothetical protein